ncbi:hypothetical protein ABK040_014904 [Willaertia magna]
MSSTNLNNDPQMSFIMFTSKSLNRTNSNSNSNSKSDSGSGEIIIKGQEIKEVLIRNEVEQYQNDNNLTFNDFYCNPLFGEEENNKKKPLYSDQKAYENTKEYINCLEKQNFYIIHKKKLSCSLIIPQNDYPGDNNKSPSSSPILGESLLKFSNFPKITLDEEDEEYVEKEKDDISDAMQEEEEEEEKEKEEEQEQEETFKALNKPEKGNIYFSDQSTSSDLILNSSSKQLLLVGKKSNNNKEQMDIMEEEEENSNIYDSVAKNILKELENKNKKEEHNKLLKNSFSCTLSEEFLKENISMSQETLLINIVTKYCEKNEVNQQKYIDSIIELLYYLYDFCLTFEKPFFPLIKTITTAFNEYKKSNKHIKIPIHDLDNNIVADSNKIGSSSTSNAADNSSKGDIGGNQSIYLIKDDPSEEEKDNVLQVLESQKVDNVHKLNDIIQLKNAGKILVFLSYILLYNYQTKFYQEDKKSFIKLLKNKPRFKGGNANKKLTLEEYCFKFLGLFFSNLNVHNLKLGQIKAIESSLRE